MRIPAGLELFVDTNIFLYSITIILKGQVIEDYPEDQPFPRCLIFKMRENEPFYYTRAFFFDSVML